MRTFAEYRKKMFVETAPTEAAPQTTMHDNLAADLERTIDQFVNQLKQQLANPMTGPDAQRGIWDRMKNWWSNMWHGRYNQQNPYFWQNKLGDDLGRTTESSLEPLPLEHYMLLYEQATTLENALAPGAEKLQVIRIVDQWARQFKNTVLSMVARHNTPVATPNFSEPHSEDDHEVPTVGHEPEEERDDSHIHSDDEGEGEGEEEGHAGYDDLEEKRHKLMDALKALKGKMSPTAYATVERDILSGDEAALNRAEMFMTKRTAVLGDPADSAPATAPKPVPATPAAEEDDPSVAPPKADKRQWKELSPHEKEQWDAAGGGHGTPPSLYARHNFDIKGLPWILRIGDPRLTHLESISGRQLYTKLVRQKRIELPSNPIRTKDQLAKAVEEAKRLHEEEYSATSADRTERHKRRVASTPPPSGPPTDPAPVPPRTAPLPTGDEPSDAPVPPPSRKRTAKLDDAAPGDGPPAAKEKKKGRVKPPRTAPMGEKPVEEPSINPDELRSDLESLKGEIDEDIYARMASMIDRGGESPELLASVKRKLAVMKAQVDDNKDDGMDKIESTIKDRTAFLISNFKHKINESGQAVSIHGSRKKKHVFHSRLQME